MVKANSKLLAEWFWTDRWIGSSGFLLPLEPRGLYREMLTQSWRRQAHLPNDHEAIRRAVGCTIAEWRRCWPKVEKYWRVEGDALVNDTQLEVWRLTMDAHLRAVERGRKGGLRRACAHTQAEEQVENKQSTTTNQLVLKHKPPSPSPRSLGVKNTPSVRPRQERADPPTPTRQAFERYFARFEQTYGVKPALDRKKDGERMRRLLVDAGGLEAVQERIDAFFDSGADPFFAKCSHTLDVFFSAGTQTKLTTALSHYTTRINGCHHTPPCQSVTEHYKAEQREYDAREAAKAAVK